MGFREIDILLRKNGWKVVRISDSSHYQYKKNNCPFTATVPRHSGNKDVSIGVIVSLERGTGLSFRKR